mmetsp:Transcript_14490/g.47237  ORF Transcript_14490/g.47237 Transcript_14490/m.47237 type:complete len:137 (+) Transcript_14490:145-555(+)
MRPIDLLLCTRIPCERGSQGRSSNNEGLGRSIATGVLLVLPCQRSFPGCLSVPGEGARALAVMKLTVQRVRHLMKRTVLRVRRLRRCGLLLVEGTTRVPMCRPSPCQRMPKHYFLSHRCRSRPNKQQQQRRTPLQQ